MAALTVEDRPEYTNRFELVLKASQRAHELARGAAALVPWDKDKPTVVALREIRSGKWPPPEKPRATAPAAEGESPPESS